MLHYAVRYGNLEVTQYLIEQGADIHAREKRGWNILHLAARNGQAEKARLLLENGIDVHECQTSGWNSLHLAVRYDKDFLDRRSSFKSKLNSCFIHN